MAAPTVTSVNPSSGSTLGGTSVYIVGTGFTGASAVTFGGTAATSFTVESATAISAVTPAKTAGAAAVVVTNDGASNATINFTYTSTAGMLLFTEAELRAFAGAKLPSAVSAADIVLCEARIREQFADILGFYVYTTSYSEYLDGTGTQELLLTKQKVSSVTACVVYNSDGSTNETFDATDLADLAIYPDGLIRRRSLGYFAKGYRNVYVTHESGWTVIPADVKRAGMIVAMSELTNSYISDRATSFSDGVTTTYISTAGQTNRPYGIPSVDSILMRYAQKLPGIA